MAEARSPSSRATRSMGTSSDSSIVGLVMLTASSKTGLSDCPCVQVYLSLHDGEMANRIVLDVAPLRGSREFRILFSCQLAVLFASQLTLVAIPFQVYALTRSSLQVGTVSLAQLVPLIVGALVGGST